MAAQTEEPLRRIVERTSALQASIADHWRMHPDAATRALEQAGEELTRQGVRLAAGGAVPTVLGAVLIDDAAERSLAAIAERLHAIVENALDWTLSEPDRLDRFFRDHRRMAPHLRRGEGLRTWQGYSRFDCILGPDGRFRIIELNTGCPGAFQNAPRIQAATRDAIASALDVAPGTLGSTAAAGPEALARHVLAVEERAGPARDLVAVLVDENELRYELTLMRDTFRRLRRKAEIINAAELERRADGRLCFRGEPISVTFNKFRISTPRSPNHCWRDGFESRYEALLAALADGAVASVNGIAALTVAEDKGLLALLQHPEFRRLLAQSDRTLIDAHVAWTARLEDVLAGSAERPDGEAVPGSLDDLLAQRRTLVSKPANEGRGFQVYVGAATGNREWRDACREDPHLPRVIQESCDPLTLPMPAIIDGRAELVDQAIVVSVALIDGRYAGCHVRASAQAVANGARGGATIAVLRSAP